MAFATFTDVEARAGRYAPLFQVAGKQPDQDTVNALLVDVSAELTGALVARGFDAPYDSAATAALVDVAAYGALARALASVPAGDRSLDELKAYATQVWAAGLAAVAAGVHPAVAVLEGAGGGASAGSFWGDEPEYGQAGVVVPSAEDVGEPLAPGFWKGQTL